MEIVLSNHICVPVARSKNKMCYYDSIFEFYSIICKVKADNE